MHVADLAKPAARRGGRSRIVETIPKLDKSREGEAGRNPVGDRTAGTVRFLGSFGSLITSAATPLLRARHPTSAIPGKAAKPR
jgi:hypothetical protein